MMPWNWIVWRVVRRSVPLPRTRANVATPEARARYWTQRVSFHAFSVPVSPAASSPTPSTHAPFEG